MTSRRHLSLLAPAALLALAVLTPTTAHAGLGVRTDSWNWADSKGTTNPRVISRYATVPVRTATGTGTIDYPQLPNQLWNYATASSRVPLETWTLTAIDAGSFTVVGSVSGAQANLNVNASYTTANGINFTVFNGATAYVAGDKFEFAVVDHLDTAALPGATSRVIPPTGFTALPRPGFNIQANGASGDNGLIVYDAGYLALTSTGDPRFLDHYTARQLPNAALPAREVTLGNTSTILPFWDELAQKPTSRVWTAVVGRIGQRRYIVEYKDFAHAGDPTSSYTFQVVFFENEPRVRYHYVTLQNGTQTSANGSTATVGLQGPLGRSYAASPYSANTGSLAAGLTIEFGLDNDQDALPWGVELAYGTNDNLVATDGGLIGDGLQLLAGLDPTSNADNGTVLVDTDADGLFDAQETTRGTNPAVKDTDGDGLEDGAEVNAANATDPKLADTDGDGRSDGQEDADKSGNVNGTETNPRAWDSDDDGVDDGTEIAQGTDPNDATSGRVKATIQLPDGRNSAIFAASALDSKGNLHLVWSSRGSRNDSPDEMFVALMSPTAGIYGISVAATRIEAHTGFDDRVPTIVTAPGAAGSTVDRTLVINSTSQGYTFLTEIDFGAAARDGSASTSAALVKTTRMLSFAVGSDHPVAQIVGDKIHLVFQGQLALDTDRFAKVKIERGSYYTQISLAGDVVVQPTLMFQKDIPAHHHTYPRIAVDSAGNIHSVVRGGVCRWNVGPSGCALYYTKLSSTGAALIPTTKLQLEGNGGFHRSPEILVAPNGLVNIVYTSNGKLVTGNGQGGYSVGNEVRLLAFSTVNNQITTVIDQKPLTHFAPERSWGAGDNASLNTFRTPAAVMDAGGNIHLFVVEDNNLSDGLYAAYAPNGDRKIGPYYLRGADDWGLDSLQVTATTALLVAKNGATRVAQVDISGLGLDLTGNSQPPVPGAADLAVTAVAPNSVAIGGTTAVTISGTGFVAGSTVTIGGVALTGVVLYNATTLVGTLDASALAEGAHDVTVSNPNAAMATLAGGFYVGVIPTEEPPPATDDGGCCDVRGASPVGSLLLTAIVLAGLGRRRRRQA